MGIFDPIIDSFHKIEYMDQKVSVIYISKKALSIVQKDKRYNETITTNNKIIYLLGVKVVVRKIPYGASFICVGEGGTKVLGSIRNQNEDKKWVRQ